MNNGDRVKEVIVCLSIITFMVLFLIGISVIMNSFHIDKTSIIKPETEVVLEIAPQSILVDVMRQLDDILLTTNDITQADIQLKALQNTLIIITDYMRHAEYLDYEGLMYYQWLTIEIAKRQKLMRD